MISAMGDATECFSANYVDARKRFVAACQRDEVEVESIAYASHDAGESNVRSADNLSMDVAWLGNRDSKRLCVLSSGLHGLEGRLGSACQLAAMLHGNLHQFAAQRDWCVLLIHALNPFGFANDRRWDADGVDPNRNFLFASERYEGVHPIYQQLEDLLNPGWAPTWRDRWTFYYQAVRAISKHGFTQVKQAIAEGQYEAPRGLFFGGKAPGWTQRALEHRLAGWISPFDHIVHIDVHSGLGRWGECQLLMDYQCRDWQRRWMERFPSDSWEAVEPSGIAYNARGGLGRWCDNRFADRQYHYLCAEVGTYGPIRVLRALRLENQAWRHLDRRPTKIVEEAREMFCPRSAKWRNKAVASVWDVVHRTIFGPDEAAT